jgi:TRAP-type C4-dicarboxylate transport system permease small subunit
MTIEVQAMIDTPAAAGGLRQALARLADGISRAVDLILGLGMIAAVLLNFANVLGRYVFGIAIVGADELLIYAMIATIFLGAISVTWKDAHLKLDVLVDGMPPRLQAIARRGAHLVLALLCCIVGYAAAHMAWEMAHFDQRSLAAGLPMVVPHGAVTIGLFLMAFMALLRFFGISSALEPAAPAGEP